MPGEKKVSTYRSGSDGERINIYTTELHFLKMARLSQMYFRWCSQSCIRHEYMHDVPSNSFHQVLNYACDKLSNTWTSLLDLTTLDIDKSE